MRKFTSSDVTAMASWVRLDVSRPNLSAAHEWALEPGAGWTEDLPAAREGIDSLRKRAQRRVCATFCCAPRKDELHFATISSTGHAPFPPAGRKGFPSRGGRFRGPSRRGFRPGRSASPSVPPLWQGRTAQSPRRSMSRRWRSRFRCRRPSAVRVRMRRGDPRRPSPASSRFDRFRFLSALSSLLDPQRIPQVRWDRRASVQEPKGGLDPHPLLSLSLSRVERGVPTPRIRESTRRCAAAARKTGANTCRSGSETAWRGTWWEEEDVQEG